MARAPTPPTGGLTHRNAWSTNMASRGSRFFAFFNLSMTCVWSNRVRAGRRCTNTTTHIERCTRSLICTTLDNYHMPHVHCSLSQGTHQRACVQQGQKACTHRAHIVRAGVCFWEAVQKPTCHLHELCYHLHICTREVIEKLLEMAEQRSVRHQPANEGMADCWSSSQFKDKGCNIVGK